MEFRFACLGLSMLVATPSIARAVSDECLNLLGLRTVEHLHRNMEALVPTVQRESELSGLIEIYGTRFDLTREGSPLFSDAKPSEVFHWKCRDGRMALKIAMLIAKHVSAHDAHTVMAKVTGRIERSPAGIYFWIEDISVH